MKTSAISKLLYNIKAYHQDVSRLLLAFKEAEEDFVYRFYHQSFKVFNFNDYIVTAKELFLKCAPDPVTLNKPFLNIVDEALEKKFNDETNKNWEEETRPILEAFWHCKYFLEQMEQYGNELDECPQILPSGWAAVLHLYNLK